MSARAESSIVGCGFAGVTLPQPLDRHCHSKVMRRFEPNVDPESSELFAAFERTLSE